MRSPLQIANAALTKIGAAPIMAFSDLSKEAVYIRQRLPECIGMMLRDHTWAFAKRFTTLTAVVNPGPLPSPWTTKFTLPDGHFKILSLTDSGGLVGYEQFGMDVFTTSASAELRYIAWPAGGTVDENQAVYPEDFAEAAACFVASEICVTMANSGTMKQAYQQDYSELIRKARFNGSIERGTDIIIKADDWIESRVSYGEYSRQGRDLDVPPEGFPFNSGP